MYWMATHTGCAGSHDVVQWGVHEDDQLGSNHTKEEHYFDKQYHGHSSYRRPSRLVAGASGAGSAIKYGRGRLEVVAATSMWKVHRLRT